MNYLIFGLENGSVILEMKDGAYEPLGEEDMLSLWLSQRVLGVMAVCESEWGEKRVNGETIAEESKGWLFAVWLQILG